MDTYRQKFYDNCNFIYMRKKKFSEMSYEDAMRESITEAKVAILNQGIDISEDEFREWTAKIWSEINIEIPCGVSNQDEKRVNEGNYPKETFFWERYRSSLEKDRDSVAINEIDKYTERIMSHITPPREEGFFDKRGLVLGYVQSGKTANFIGVINKAFDRNYNLIIVLAGMSDALRTQTQERVNREVLSGSSSLEADDNNYVRTLTNEMNEFKYRYMTSALDLNKKSICVVKKNSSVLKDLIRYLAESEGSFGDSNVLIVDDEADQASVNTAVLARGEEPKTINKLIRQILELFDRKSYVGYTATPFANLLIDVEEEHPKFKRDIFPKDFVINLPKPRGYYGPEEYFEDISEERTPIRLIDYNESAELAKVSDNGFVNPGGLTEAVRHFLLVASIREEREQKKES